MSQLVSIRIDTTKAQAAFSAAPEVVRRHVEPALLRGANEIAAEEKRLAPKSLSALVNSIIVSPAGELAYQVSPGVGYAAYVVHGSGPAAGRAKYYPNPDNLLQYLMTSPRARGFTRFKRSAKGRLDQENELVRRSQAFAWWIYQHGTKPQDFVTPAVEGKRDACTQFVRDAVTAGVAEIFGAGTVRERWERRR